MATTWDAIAPLFAAEGLTREAPALVALVRAALDADEPVARAAAIAELTGGLMRDHGAVRVLETLSLSTDATVWRLALELVTRLPPPLDPALAKHLGPLLRDRRMPPPLLLAAAAALVRLAGRDRQYRHRVWTDFAQGYGKRRLLEDQARLRKRFPRPRHFDQFCTHVRRHMRIRCPHCKARLASAKMPRHLWTQHGRVFDGGRARKPWQFLDAASPGTDPAERLTALNRLMQRHRLRDVAALDQLYTAAGAAKMSVCPYCWGTVPVVAPPRSCDVSDTRLAGQGYRIEVLDGRLGSHLGVLTPAGVVYDGPEPGNVTPSAMARFAAAAPFVALAFLVAVACSAPFALLATAAALLAALVAYRWAARTDRARTGDRAIDHAWSFLASDPERRHIAPQDAAFLAGLALASIGRGDPVARAATVRLWVDALDPADTKVWAAFQALDAADTFASGGDPIPRVAAAIGAGFGDPRRFPAAVALAELCPQVAWTAAMRARLRVLLVESAWAAGLGVWDLHELGVALPPLDTILGSDDTDGLARLHRLWTLRPSRPWSRCGPAATAFEVALYPDLAREHFAEALDLLLYLPVRSDGEAESIILSGRGVLFRQILMADRSVPISYRPRTNGEGGGYAMTFGTSQLAFAESPVRIAARLECWADFWFREFLPGVDESLAVPAGRAVKSLLAAVASKCPECGKASVTAVGRAGVKLK